MLSLYKFSPQALVRVSKPGHVKVQEACDIKESIGQKALNLDFKGLYVV